MSEIKPALTALQWLETEEPEYSGDHKRNTLFAYIAPEEYRPGTEPGELVVGWNGDRMHPMSPQQRHALAALCLNGQPFGFTREDVEVLREADINLLDLADRIEALLPPETAR